MVVAAACAEAERAKMRVARTTTEPATAVTRTSVAAGKALRSAVRKAFSSKSPSSPEIVKVVCKVAFGEVAVALGAALGGGKEAELAVGGGGDESEDVGDGDEDRGIP